MSVLIKLGDAAITMTSLELVQFINNQRAVGDVELRHDHFMAKVPKVLGQDHAPKFRDMVSVAIGSGATRQSPIYRFPKREACLMAMSYSYDLQAKVFDRMTALESGLAPTVNMRDPKQLAAAAMQLIEVNHELQERIDAQQRQIVEVVPKAEALDRIADAEGLMTPTNVAKALQLPPNRVFDFMRTNGWTYRRPGARSDVAYQDKIAAGCLTHKVHLVHRDDGSEKVCEQVMVTPKGLTKLAQAMGAN